MTSTIRQTKAARKDRPWFLNADLKGLTHPSREGTPLRRRGGSSGTDVSGKAALRLFLMPQPPCFSSLSK